MTPEEHLAHALAGIGFAGDPEMARTPELLAAFLRERLPVPLPRLEPLVTGSTDLVVLRAVPFHALCAHHLLPFFGSVTLAFRPAGRICGLGSLAKLVLAVARGPQLQERMAATLADALQGGLAPVSAGVRVEARHMCLEMRGAQVPATCEVLAVRGADDPELRMALVRA